MNKATPRPANVSQSVLDEIVRRIVETAEPEKIILFGSTARGDAGPDSDLDFLVVKTGAHRRKLGVEIRRSLYGVRVAIDVVVATPEDLDRYGNSHALVYKHALFEGMVLYDAAAERVQAALRE